MACADACDSMTYLQQVEKILFQLQSFFDNSVKKSAAYAKAVLKVKSLNLSRQGKKKIKTRIQKACRTRWLSTNRAIEGVYEDFKPLITVLKSFKEDGDATATGLLKQAISSSFVRCTCFMTYFLFCHILARFFQKGRFHLAVLHLQ